MTIFILYLESAIIILFFLDLGAGAVLNAVFGEGTGPVLLHEVRCAGHEHRLINCPSGGIERNTCPHSQDAGVICPTGT